LRQTGRSPLLLVLMLSALPTLGAAVEPGGEVPRGYVRLERSGWAWAIPRGSGPPPEALSSRITERLVSIRRRLGRSGTISPVVVRAAHRTEFRRVTRELGGRDPELFVDALAFPTRGIVVYDAERLRSNSIRRAEVLAHEIAHVVLGEAGAGVPRWYHEGAAQWLAGESLAPEMPRLLRRLAAQEALYTFAELPPFPPESQRGTSIYYAQAHLFILHWNDRFGPGESRSRPPSSRRRASRSWRSRGSGTPGSPRGTPGSVGSCSGAASTRCSRWWPWWPSSGSGGGGYGPSPG
jgi:hypothetical protein